MVLGCRFNLWHYLLVFICVGIDGIFLTRISPHVEKKRILALHCAVAVFHLLVFGTWPSIVVGERRNKDRYFTHVIKCALYSFCRVANSVSPLYRKRVRFIGEALFGWLVNSCTKLSPSYTLLESSCMPANSMIVGYRSSVLVT